MNTASISRNPLAPRRAHTSFNMKFGPAGQQSTVSVGLGHYPDGRIGEVFITSRKIGSQLEAECTDVAVLISIALQNGITPKQLYHAMDRTPEGGPVSVAGHVLNEIIEMECGT